MVEALPRFRITYGDGTTRVVSAPSIGHAYWIAADFEPPFDVEEILSDEENTNG